MKLTRVLSLVLVALLLAACLSSCGLVEDIKSMFGMETQPVDDPADDIPENQEYKLVSNGAPQYVIVYDYKAGPQTKNAVLTMVEAFKTRLNCTIEARECYSDRVVDEVIVQEKEILIGNTNRPESAILSDNMKTNDSDVDVINGKVVIAGGSDAATAKAVNSIKYNAVQIRENVLATEARSKIDSMDKQKEQFATLSAHVNVAPTVEAKTENTLNIETMPDRIRISVESQNQRTIMQHEPKSFHFVIESTEKLTLNGPNHDR